METLKNTLVWISLLCLVIFKLCVSVQQYTHDLTIESQSSHHANLNSFHFVHPLFNTFLTAVPDYSPQTLISPIQAQVHRKLLVRGIFWPLGGTQHSLPLPPSPISRTPEPTSDSLGNNNSRRWNLTQSRLEEISSLEAAWSHAVFGELYQSAYSPYR